MIRSLTLIGLALFQLTFVEGVAAKQSSGHKAYNIVLKYFAVLQAGQPQNVQKYLSDTFEMKIADGPSRTLNWSLARGYFLVLDVAAGRLVKVECLDSGSDEISCVSYRAWDRQSYRAFPEKFLVVDGKISKISSDQWKLVLING